MRSDLLVHTELWVFGYAMNALWQVPLVFAAAWIAARLARRNGPATQHRIWVGALLLETVLPACSFPLQQWLQMAIASMHSSANNASGARVTVTTGAGIVHGGLQMAPAWLTIAATLYGGALLYFALRLAVGLSHTTALHHRAQPSPLHSTLVERCARYAHIFGVHNAVVAISNEIISPLTLGIHQRILMLPTDVEATISSEDLEAALAHEFAHMQRRDFAKNLLYELISLPIALHPVRWLTRRHIAETREMVCDALAAEAVHGRERYARSLLRLATTFSAATQLAHIHAIGIFDANHAENFERRVMNLTEKRVDIRGIRRAATVAACTALGLTACASALALHMQVAPQNVTPPTSVTVAVPRPTTGQPVQQFAMEVATTTAPATASATAAATSAPARIHVLTPATVEEAPTTVDETQTEPGTLQVGSGVMAGNILSKTQPVYPQEAKDQKIQGAVVLDAVISKDGSIKSLKLVSGPKELSQSAWDAVKQWTYKPYLLNGNPTEVETTITVNYHLAE
jgi:TonB family protein